mmetsp:Transcript_11436/g.23208  ORF Transcript_11436/g.23208 Transcript_11436/m.23208 type:complete len:324 (-) Transcript_11436:58-1029(-)
MAPNPSTAPGGFTLKSSACAVKQESPPPLCPLTCCSTAHGSLLRQASSPVTLRQGHRLSCKVWFTASRSGHSTVSKPPIPAFVLILRVWTAPSVTDGFPVSLSIQLGQRLSGPLWRTAMRLRALHPLPVDSLDCDAAGVAVSPDPLGHHTLIYSRGLGSTRRHHVLCRCLPHWVYRDAERAEVVLEWTLPDSPLRLDTLVMRVSGDRVGLDFTISSPYAASNIRARSSRPLLNRMEDRKRAHYVSAVASLVPATSFCPLRCLDYRAPRPRRPCSDPHSSWGVRFSSWHLLSHRRTPSHQPGDIHRHPVGRVPCAHQAPRPLSH